jgi:parallel beta-helix repeat protein
MATLALSSLPVLSFVGYPALWTGDTATGDASAATALQAAIDACDGVLDLAPGATYLIDAAVTLKSDLHIRLNGSTLLSGASNTIFTHSSAGLHDVLIEGPGTFDGTAAYPVDETVAKTTVTARYGVSISSTGGYNIEVRKCHFSHFAGGGVYITAPEGKNIKIKDNTADKGHYVLKSFSVYGNPGLVEADAVANVEVTGNVVEGGGPTGFTDATVVQFLNSSDGIHLDACKDSVVANNTVRNVAGIGIRIEENWRTKVINNTVEGSGGDGILVYFENHGVIVQGNTVKNWGRLPYAAALLDYSGTLVVCREMPHTSLAPFPADPTASSWWEEWPHTLTGIDEDTIVDWADRSYYTSGPPESGSLAFRGHSGIAVTQASDDCIVTDNICIPDLTQESGKYTHASDFGISIVHSINSPHDDAAARVGLIAHNIAEGRVADIYTPAYRDPINERGPLGTVVVGTNIPSA